MYVYFTTVHMCGNWEIVYRIGDGRVASPWETCWDPTDPSTRVVFRPFSNTLMTVFVSDTDGRLRVFILTLFITTSKKLS